MRAGSLVYNCRIWRMGQLQTALIQLDLHKEIRLAPHSWESLLLYVSLEQGRRRCCPQFAKGHSGSKALTPSLSKAGSLYPRFESGVQC